MRNTLLMKISINSLSLSHTHSFFSLPRFKRIAGLSRTKPVKPFSGKVFIGHCLAEPLKKTLTRTTKNIRVFNLGKIDWKMLHQKSMDESAIWLRATFCDAQTEFIDCMMRCKRVISIEKMGLVRRQTNQRWAERAIGCVIVTNNDRELS